MSNLQYIGARYVPKFYENSQDPSSTDWEQVAFEPLTVVTDNSDSYTSRKPVPASVGRPADNPAFWARTGNFNASLVALQNAINNVDTDVKRCYYNVKDFGAVGDGVTDDTTIIQSLLDQYDYLYFPTGTYLITDKITHSGKCSIAGDGAMNSILKFNGSNAGIELTMTAYSADDHLKNNVIISDVTFLRDSNYGGAAISIDGTNVNRVDRCGLSPIIQRIQVTGENGGYWINGIILHNCNCASINSCSFTGHTTGVLEAGNFDVNDAVYIYCDDSMNSTEYMTYGNKITAWSNGFHMGEHTEGLQIIASTIIGVKNGIYLDAPNNGFTHLCASSNHIWAMQHCIYGVHAKQAFINDNLLYLAAGEYTTANVIAFEGAGTQQINIHNNIIQCTDYGTYQKDGIYVGGGRYYNIHDNMMFGAHTAFYLDSCAEVTMKWNVVIGWNRGYQLASPSLVTNGIRYFGYGGVDVIDQSNANPQPGEMFDPGDGMIRWITAGGTIKALQNL